MFVKLLAFISLTMFSLTAIANNPSMPEFGFACTNSEGYIIEIYPSDQGENFVHLDLTTPSDVLYSGTYLLKNGVNDIGEPLKYHEDENISFSVFSLDKDSAEETAVIYRDKRLSIYFIFTECSL